MSAIALAAVGISLAAAVPARAATEMVRPGESIQAAIDAAQAGDTISVAPGVFHENLAITKNDITVRGSGAGRHGTVLMPAAAPGLNPCSDPYSPELQGFCVVGEFDPATGEPGMPISDVTIGNLTVDGFTGFGVFAFNARDLTVARVRARNNAGYGISDSWCRASASSTRSPSATASRASTSATRPTRGPRADHPTDRQTPNVQRRDAEGSSDRADDHEHELELRRDACSFLPGC